MGSYDDDLDFPPRRHSSRGPRYQEATSQNLLSTGWKPLYRQLDPVYVWDLLSRDPLEMAQKALDVCSDVADTLGRQQYAWWANMMQIFSEDLRYEMGEFWDYITPPPTGPNHTYKDVLSAVSPVDYDISRDRIPIAYVLSRLEDVTVQKVLQLLGRPTQITQSFMERNFYYPVERFTDWEQLEILGIVSAYWQEKDLWLQIRNTDRTHRRFTIIGKDLSSWVNKATHNLAVMLSGYQCRIGQVQSPFPLDSFPTDIQGFSDQVQQSILTHQNLAVLAHGVPGTGKTAWTQAIAREVLVPLGYVIFILDHDAVQNFVPPSYLERICLIINEADNLAQDRGSDFGRSSTKTEHILSLLDGTLYQSVVDESMPPLKQRLVVLMTCNTTERMDPALLRRGRVDLTHEFAHIFVSGCLYLGAERL